MANRSAGIALASLLLQAIPLVSHAGPTEPYTAGCHDLASAMREADRGRTDRAVRILDGLLEGRSSMECEGVPPQEALKFLKGTVLERAGRLEDALESYWSAAWGPLSDISSYRAGRLALRLGDPARARAAFARVAVSSSAWMPAMAGLADALTLEGRPSTAMVVAEAAFGADPSPRELCALRLSAARSLIEMGESDRARECALAAYLRCPAREKKEAARLVGTAGPWPTRLHERLRKLLHAGTRDLRRTARYARKHRKAFDRIDPGLRPFVIGLYYSRSRKTRDKAARLLESASERARDPELAAHALYRLGRVKHVLGDDDGALSLYRRTILGFPGSCAAADAALAAAWEYARRGDVAGVRETAITLAGSRPEAGIARQARWAEAVAAMVSGDWALAASGLDRLVERLEGTAGVPWGDAERFLYFDAVAYLNLGRGERAGAKLRRVARGFPHTYYGCLASERLGSARDARLDPPMEPRSTSRKELYAHGRAAFDLDAAEARWGPAANGPVMLWRLGFRRLAMSELGARARAGLLDEQDMVLLAGMKAHGKPLRRAMGARTFLRGFPSSWSAGLFAALYPTPFLDEALGASRDSGVDPALIYGVMRAESRFKIRARSHAGAVGLMQVMPATARAVARLLGKPGEARKLRRPSVNIRLGSVLLGELWRHFKGSVPLVLAGYNAGAGAARRFLRKYGRLGADLMVETLPFRSTAAFIRRVVAFYAGYKAMYWGGDLRGMVELPGELGPFMAWTAEPSRPASAWSDTRIAKQSVNPGSSQIHRLHRDSSADTGTCAALASPIWCSTYPKYACAQIGLPPCPSTRLDPLGRRFDGGFGFLTPG